MKDYIKQFYTEGLAYIFCVVPINYLKKHIKNTNIISVLSFIIRFIFTIIVLGISLYILYSKWPF